jgi:hypothetical protein
MNPEHKIELLLAASPPEGEMAEIDEAYGHVNRMRLVTSVGLSPGVYESIATYDIRMLAVFSGVLPDIGSWVFADLLVKVESDCATLADRDARWAELCRMARREFSQHTLLNLRATARAWPFHKRRHTDVLTFEHHRLLVSYSGEEREFWMDTAQDMGWSSTRLRHELYARREDITLPLDPADIPHSEISDWLGVAGIELQREDDKSLTLTGNGLTVQVVAVLKGQEACLRLRYARI